MIIESLGMSKPCNCVSLFATCGRENVTEKETRDQWATMFTQVT